MWYDVYVQLDDDAVVVYAGERGQAMTKIVDTTTDVASSTDRIQFTVENLGANGRKEFEQWQQQRLRPKA